AASPARIRYCANLRTPKNNCGDAAAKATLRFRRDFAIARPLRRSCAAADPRVFSSRASQNAASAERGNGTAADRFAPADTESSPRRWPCGGCRRSMPFHRSVRLALRPPAQNRPGKCRFLLLTARTSCLPCHLHGKGNRRAPAAACRFPCEKARQDSWSANTTEDKRYLPSYNCVTVDRVAAGKFFVSFVCFEVNFTAL